MRRSTTILLILAACSPPPVATATARSLAPAAVSSGTAGVPGALAGDGISDRVAIQAAIDAVAAAPDGGTAYLTAGRWTLDRAPAGTYNRFAALHIGAKPAIGGAPATHGRHVTIRGAGPETVLELVGDQGGATTIVLDVMPGAEHVRIADLTIDTTAASNTDEQTHAIATSGTCEGAACRPIRGVTIENVTFRHPRVDPAHRKGDCIRLLGNTDATRVYGVRIAGNHFLDCARSAVTIQRGVYDLVVIGNPRIRALKTCIDGEATGGPTDTDARAAITGNTFDHCSTAISLTSYQGATITGNNVVGAITLHRSTGVTIAGNTIAHTAVDGNGTVDVKNSCDGLAITGNAITRTGAPGAGIKIVPHASVCQRFTVGLNTIALGNASFGVYLESPSYAAVVGNQITYTAPAPGLAAIYARAVTAAAPVTGLVIASNNIAGSISYGVQLVASPATFGTGILVSGNVATGPSFGLQLSSAPGFTAPITVLGNAMGLPLYGAVQVTPGT